MKFIIHRYDKNKLLQRKKNQRNVAPGDCTVCLAGLQEEPV